jgi:hypothetical protein
MARSAGRQAVAATVQAEAAKAQLESVHRPVLVPFQKSTEKVVYRGGEIPAGCGPHIVENPRDRPDLPLYSAALLPVHNVGMGPALNVRGAFTGPSGAGEVRFPAEAVAVGGHGVVAFENWTGESLGYTGNDSSVSAVLEYEDVAGRVYRTRVVFDIGNNAYRSTLEAANEGGLSGASLTSIRARLRAARGKTRRMGTTTRGGPLS